VSLGEAVEAITRATAEIGMPNTVIGGFQGNAQIFQTSLSSEPALVAGALVVVYIILGMLYESFIHPFTILSTLPGVGALLALNFGHMDLSVISIIGIILLIGIVQKNGIMLVDFAVVAERERTLPPVAAIREACLLPVPADPDDDGGGTARRPANGVQPRHRLRATSAAWLLHRRRPGAEPAAHTLYDTRRVPLPRSPPTLDIDSPAEPEIRSCDHCGRPPAPHDGNRHHGWPE
jgi:hypothetical protein